jgi:hypothetical protein
VALATATGPVPVKEGITRRWYADVPLNPSGTPVALTATFEGAMTRAHEIAWQPTNALVEDAMTIRAGDSLLLTGHPGVAPQPGSSVTLNFSNGGSETFDPSQPLARTFAVAGNVSVAVSHTDPAGSVTLHTFTVQVRQATFGPNFPVYAGRPRVWSLPGIPVGLVLDPDPSLFFFETAAVNGARAAEVEPVDATMRNVLARVQENGPIAARGTVASLDVSSTTTTSDTEVVHTYDNGDRIVRMGVVVDNLPPGGYVKLTIFVSGVTFTDGTLNKTLYASSFDSNGLAYVYFNYPANQSTSVCHRLYVYDAQNNLIGTR